MDEYDEMKRCMDARQTREGQESDVAGHYGEAGDIYELDTTLSSIERLVG